MKEYVQLPSAMLGEAAAAKQWIARALEWTSQLPAETKGRAKPGTSPGKAAPKRLAR
jgi:hypothetical protein